ncbi:glycosyltransferase family 2 protein [Aestuariibius insulae]|uniref:glycosyltransferase family 2 protein n=1 Tax=Aestuariibius insulae TaxID=2058287 RepID=UPI00398EB987
MNQCVLQYLGFFDEKIFILTGTSSDEAVGPPDVAVIIPAWNAETTVSRAIDSALSQVGVSVEVIVVDDASTDGTVRVLSDLAALDRRVTFLQQSRNMGPAAARNRALDAATAPYVTPLDSDDFMEEGRLATLLDLAKQGSWDIVADDLYKMVAGSDEMSRTRLWSRKEIGVQAVDLPFFVKGNLSELHGDRGELGFLKPLIYKAFLDQIGLRYDEGMRLGEDYLLYATALVQGAQFCLTDPAGYVAVVRDDSLSGSHRAKDLGALVQADSQLLSEVSDDPQAKALIRRHRLETWKRWAWMRLIEAVRDRDGREVFAAFRGPPGVGLSLMGRLAEQAYLRTARRLSGRASR